MTPVRLVRNGLKSLGKSIPAEERLSTILITPHALLEASAGETCGDVFMGGMSEEVSYDEEGPADPSHCVVASVDGGGDGSDVHRIFPESADDSEEDSAAHSAEVTGADAERCEGNAGDA